MKPNTAQTTQSGRDNSTYNIMEKMKKTDKENPTL
jgi:hypothetical protein